MTNIFLYVFIGEHLFSSAELKKALLEQPNKGYLRCNFLLPLFLQPNYNVVIGADLQRANSVCGTAEFLQREPFVSINIEELCLEYYFCSLKSNLLIWTLYSFLFILPTILTKGKMNQNFSAPPVRPGLTGPSGTLKNATGLTQKKVRACS